MSILSSITSDATTARKGLIKLANQLAGTSNSPEIVGLKTGSTSLTIGTITDGEYLKRSGSSIISSTTSSELPSGYIDGLNLSNNGTDANNDIDIGTGVCRDSANAYSLTNSSTKVKQLDATWAAGTNQGGLFSGTKSANTWYHVFAIRKDADGTIDFGFDTSITATNKPSGYSNYRRLGSILTNGSSNIIGFVQTCDEFLWKDPPLDVDVNNPGTSAVTRTLSVPPDVIVMVYMNIVATVSSGGGSFSVYISSLNVNDEAASTSAGPLCQIRALSPMTGTEEFASHLIVHTNTSKQIRTRQDASAASHNFRIATLGWIDMRGKS